MSEPSLTGTIRGIVASRARLGPGERVRDQDDLFRAGMTSHATVNVMLGLEEAFDIEFPDEMLSRSTFQSIASIRQAVEDLLAQRS